MPPQPSQRSTVRCFLGGSQCYLTLKRACKKCPNRCQGWWRPAGDVHWPACLRRESWGSPECFWRTLPSIIHGAFAFVIFIFVIPPIHCSSSLLPAPSTCAQLSFGLTPFEIDAGWPSALQFTLTFDLELRGHTIQSAHPS
jgi:hypothetical protein